MKHSIVFILLSFLFVNFSTAQTSKGNFMMGGALGFSVSNTNTTVEQAGVDDIIGKTTTSSFDFTPKIGYFIVDNFAVGLQFEYTVLRAKTENETNTASKFLTGPFARYYFRFGESNKAIFLESNFGFGRTSVGEDENNVSTSLLGFGVGPGVTIFSNDFIGIEALAKYNWVKGKTVINDVTSTEVVGEIDLSVGLQIYFARMVRAGKEK